MREGGREGGRKGGREEGRARGREGVLLQVILCLRLVVQTQANGSLFTMTWYNNFTNVHYAVI